MKFRKNLEAVFLAAAVLGTFASYATAEVPAIQVAQVAPANVVAADASMQVVVITGQRLSAAEKAALD
ncbi:MAG: hypothetical protein ACJ8LG_20750 [Massilia sp.]